MNHFNSDCINIYILQDKISVCKNIIQTVGIADMKFFLIYYNIIFSNFCGQIINLCMKLVMEVHIIKKG